MVVEGRISNERVDDVPVIIKQLETMGVKQLLDKCFVTHGNWQGESLGSVAVIWLSYILSQADHRLSHVQGWVAKRKESLKKLVGEEIRELDWSDDRLESLLRYLSQDKNWQSFEEQLSRSIIRVYPLSLEQVRLDSTTGSSYCGVNTEGLFQWGHSKDHRPDLAQVKIMLSTLDPLGMPVATEILSGDKADDPLYMPAVKRLRSTLRRSGLLYIGDSKMSSKATRGEIASGKDYYLCPLSAKQVKAEQIRQYLQPVWQGKQQLTSIDYDYANGENKQIAEGFEIEQDKTTQIEGVEVNWKERQLVVRSLSLAQTREKSLRQRVQKTEDALKQLKIPRRGKRKLTNIEQWKLATEAILKRYGTAEFFHLEFQLQRVQKLKRRYLTRPSQTIESVSVEFSFEIDSLAVEQQIKLLGWRIYVTNHSCSQLSLKQAVRAYRHQYLTERGFERLKGFPLSLTPIYLQREDHVTGLIRLLSIGLRVLTLLEFQVRSNLKQSQHKLAGLYAGNPQRETAHPTAEMLLAVFQEITLTLIEVQPQVIYAHLTPLSPLQQCILTLLGFSTTIYTQLTAQSFTPG